MPVTWSILGPSITLTDTAAVVSSDTTLFGLFPLTHSLHLLHMTETETEFAVTLETDLRDSRLESLARLSIALPAEETRKTQGDKFPQGAISLSLARVVAFHLLVKLRF